VIQVILYTRKACHLCHETQADLEALQSEYPHYLGLVDIESSPALQRKYGLEIPVVEIGSFILKAPITRDELRHALAAQSGDPAEISAPVSTKTNSPGRSSAANSRGSNTWTTSDKISLWFSRNYLGVLNTLVALYLLFPFLAPVFLKAGLATPAAMIYRVYGVTCHQLAFRSFFLFGEQPVYPRAAAGVQGLLSFNQATGLSEGNDVGDIYGARNYTGSPAVGYKIAICERDVALYGGILLFGLLYAISKRRIPPLPWYLWLLIGMMPIALDGVSQLLSQPPFNFLAYRESTPFLRVFTGALFGFTTAWFGYPVINQTMRETQEMMEVKQRKVQAAQQAASKTT
jgi:uncharacterized membrane protein